MNSCCRIGIPLEDVLSKMCLFAYGYCNQQCIYGTPPAIASGYSEVFHDWCYVTTLFAECMLTLTTTIPIIYIIADCYRDISHYQYLDTMGVFRFSYGSILYCLKRMCYRNTLSFVRFSLSWSKYDTGCRTTECS